MLMAERKLRSWAELFPKSYIIAIFACDRTIYEGFEFVPSITSLWKFEAYRAQIAALESMKKDYMAKVNLIDNMIDRCEIAQAYDAKAQPKDKK